jgi:hypothetical protein
MIGRVGTRPEGAKPPTLQDFLMARFSSAPVRGEGACMTVHFKDTLP